MSRGTPIRRLSPIPFFAILGGTGWRCAWLAVLLATAGCETEQQEHFRDLNAEGVRLFQRGNYLEAREHFEVALALDSKDANLQYNLGQCCDRLGQADRAEAYYKQCLEIAKNHAACRHALAVLLYRTGRRTEADRMIEDWLIAEPQRSDAYLEDGWRLRRCGEFTQAVARFQQALHFDPRNERAMIELGQMYEEHDRKDYALMMYLRALEIDPRQHDLQERVDQLRKQGVKAPLPD
jgi:Flp pilus assembly protein TadD